MIIKTQVHKKLLNYSNTSKCNQLLSMSEYKFEITFFVDVLLVNGNHCDRYCIHYISCSCFTKKAPHQFNDSNMKQQLKEMFDLLHPISNSSSSTALNTRTCNGRFCTFITASTFHSKSVLHY